MSKIAYTKKKISDGTFFVLNKEIAYQKGKHYSKKAYSDQRGHRAAVVMYKTGLRGIYTGSQKENGLPDKAEK